MRKAIIPVLSIALLTATVLFSGCETGSSENKVAEDVVTEDRDFTDFTSVDINSLFEVVITQSDTFSIKISANSSLLDYIVLAKQGDTLRLYLNPHHDFTDLTAKAITLKATIYMPDLYGLSISGGSKVTIHRLSSTEDINITLSGLSYLKMNSVDVRNLYCQASGGSEVTGSVNASDARFEITGLSKINLGGSAKNIMLQASGASQIDLVNFPVNNASVTLREMSEATVNVKVRLDVTLRDSKLYFIGNPTMDNIDTSGLSTLKHK